MRYSVMFLLLGTVVLAPSSANACWRYRSCYGCSGCYGSCSGCYGHCYGCSGCHGGYASCWGCAGCYGCYGGSSYGCYGGTYGGGSCWGCYGAPPNNLNSALPAPATNRTSNYYETGSSSSLKVKLQVIVDDPTARITIDGQDTTSTGKVRQYESGELNAFQDFVYTVAIKRNGTLAREDDTRTVYVKAGDQVVIDFSHPLRP